MSRSTTTGARVKLCVNNSAYRTIKKPSNEGFLISTGVKDGFNPLKTHTQCECDLGKLEVLRSFV